VRGTGRSRAAKRTAVYAKLTVYAAALARLLELERAEEARAVEAKLALRPLEALVADGLVVLGLRLEPTGRFFRSYVVRLALQGGAALPAHSLEPGDVVALTQGDLSPFAELDSAMGQDQRGVGDEDDDGEEDDDTDEKAEVLQGVVLEFGTRFVDLLLSEPVVASPGPLRLSLYFSDVSYRRMEAALAEVASPDLRVLCQDLRTCLVDSFAEPTPQAASASVELAALARASPWKCDKGAVRAAVAAAEALAASRGLGPLDASQSVAVQAALGRRLSLVQGPPGTGKTRTACRLVASLVMLRRGDPARCASGDRVLACALSNVAADNLLEGCLALGLKVGCERERRKET
jgi:regulator of nonsense transcripts 1